MTLPTASRGALAGLLAAALLAAGAAGFVAPAMAEGSSNSITYHVDGDERSPAADDPVFRNETVTVTGLESGADYDLRTFDPDSGTAGEPVTHLDTSGSTSATIDTGNVSGEPLPLGWYVVNETGGGNQIDASRENAFRLTEEDLSASFTAGTVDSTGDGAQTKFTVDSNRGGTLDARVTAQGLDEDELYALFRGDENDAVERDGGAVVLRDISPGESVPVDFEAVHPASYELEVAATDTGATDTAPVTVQEREMSASFGKTVYEADTGDFITFSTGFQGTGEGYVIVGGDRVTPGAELTNFIDVLYVGGGSTVTINTRLLGSDAPAEEVYVGGSVTSYAHSPDDPVFDDLEFVDAGGERVADDLDSFRSEVGIGEPLGPLEEGRYRLLAGTGDVVVRDDGVPDFERPLARSNLFLTPPSYGNLTTYVAPRDEASATDGPGDLRSSLTERSTVTKGDRLVFEFDATGFHGTLSWAGEGADPLSGGGTMHPATLAGLLDLPAGFTIEAVQRAPGPNRVPTELDLAGAADGEAYFLAEDARGGADDAGSTDTYYLVVDTRGTGPFDGVPEPGETYDYGVGFEASPDGRYRFDRVDHAAKIASSDAVDHYPYLEPGGDGRLWTGNVTVEAPTLEYDRTDADGRPIVVNRSGATISGRINYAPGTEMSVQLLPDNRTDRQPIAVQSVDVTENGTFEISHDLAERAAGETLGLEFYVREKLFDKRAVAVVDSGDDFPAFDLVETPEELAVDENGTTTLSAGVHNPGSLPGRERVELRVAGEVVDARTLTVGGNETTTVTFDVPAGNRSVGSYDYTVVTPDDRLSGALEVRATTDPSDGGGADPGSGPDGTPTGPGQRHGLDADCH
ncbi:hypothetical protein HWV07_13210 [Natronomonas salina]|uniref:BGTF surface domain-containing protein n=1 Tax=Natronomonas salina TaxID=1710540 RepID=UPI0015B3DE29|nr:BGTF surface domain-containing protein [Natronomonas salina]QLD89935.1 hypothetical protein HWV07_13210 [Natronomonas salina]